MTDSERVGGGVMPTGTEPDNMGPGGPRRKATSSRGRKARVRSQTVLAVDEWVRQRCRVNAGWHRRVNDFVPDSSFCCRVFHLTESEAKSATRAADIQRIFSFETRCVLQSGDITTGRWQISPYRVNYDCRCTRHKTLIVRYVESRFFTRTRKVLQATKDAEIEVFLRHHKEFLTALPAKK